MVNWILGHLNKIEAFKNLCQQKTAARFLRLQNTGSHPESFTQVDLMRLQIPAVFVPSA